jgi:Flp pilus assembly protein TadG
MHVFRRLLRERRSTAAVEFSIVGLFYFVILIFAVEGGIFYIKIDTLDFATEKASRLILLNNYTTAPATATAFKTDIASASNGLLKTSSIAVSVQMTPPVSGTTAAPVNGFLNLPTTFTAGTYQYKDGACPVTTNINTGVVSAGTCTGTCAYSTTGANTIGELDTGYESTAAGVTTLYQTYTCGAGQDILVQVQFTDSTISNILGGIFGPFITTLAFQAEPTVS